MSDGFPLDLRGSRRSLTSQPLFATAVVLTLALAIGCNAAIFSAIQGLLLRPLPYPDSERLVCIHNSYPKAGVVGDAARLGVPGQGFGIVLAWPASQQVRSQLFGPGPLNLVTWPQWQSCW